MVKSRTLTLDTSSDVIAAETRSFLLRNGISEETTESHVKKIMKSWMITARGSARVRRCNSRSGEGSGA